MPKVEIENINFEYLIKAFNMKLNIYKIEHLQNLAKILELEVEDYFKLIDILAELGYMHDRIFQYPYENPNTGVKFGKVPYDFRKD